MDGLNPFNVLDPSGKDRAYSFLTEQSEGSKFKVLLENSGVGWHLWPGLGPPETRLPPEG